MKEKRVFALNTFNIIYMIILYYIVGSKSLFLYILSLSLYNIFIASFDHISIKDSLKSLKNDYTKYTLWKYLLLVIGVISLIFLLLSILFSDTISLILKIDNIMPIFIMEGLVIIVKPFIKLLAEYLENIKNNSNYLKLVTLYDVLDKILLLVIALLVFRVFKVSDIARISIFYLSKVFSGLLIVGYLFIIKKYRFKYREIVSEKINYKKTVKNILAYNSYQSITKIVKNSYYYISIIVLYIALSTRYNYSINDLEKIITFIYLYLLEFRNYFMYLTKEITKEKSGLLRLYNCFKVMLTIAIIMGIISPLVCKVIFNSPEKAIYFSMSNFLALFILLYDFTYEDIKNKVVTYISLSVGLIVKIILIIPLINSFYRMGYNLVYGDIVSTIIGMFISIVINYIYLRNKSKVREKYFERILDILYDNILLAIILILMQFIVPIDTTSYIKSVGLILIYVIVSLTFINVRNKKRG